MPSALLLAPLLVHNHYGKPVATIDASASEIRLGGFRERTVS